jgi:hypothetical protein
MDYYVYVYIDPRNYEEFYFGKGRGSRKEAHLTSTSDIEKTARIAAILGAGLHPIIRVICPRSLRERGAPNRKNAPMEIRQATDKYFVGSF